MRALAFVAVVLLGATACSGGGGEEPLCETKLSLVDNTRWALVPAGGDPFPGPPDAGPEDGGPPVRGRCLPSDVQAEMLNDEASFTINTNQCSWATVEQPARVGVTAGEPLTIRIWYFSQTRFEQVVAQVLLATGETTFWQKGVPLPAATGGLLFDTMAAPMDVAPGSPLRWHVSNHGSNTWNILEVSVTRKVRCSELAPDAAGAQK